MGSLKLVAHPQSRTRRRSSPARTPSARARRGRRSACTASGSFAGKTSGPHTPLTSLERVSSSHAHVSTLTAVAGARLRQAPGAPITFSSDELAAIQRWTMQALRHLPATLRQCLVIILFKRPRHRKTRRRAGLRKAPAHGHGRMHRPVPPCPSSQAALARAPRPPSRTLLHTEVAWLFGRFCSGYNRISFRCSRGFIATRN